MHYEMFHCHHCSYESPSVELMQEHVASQHANTPGNIQEFLNGFSDDDLRQALREIKAREYAGQLPDPNGKFSELQRMIQLKHKISPSQARRDAEFEISLMSAFKWAGIFEEKRPVRQNTA